MKLVVLESPYAGDIGENMAYARRCLMDSLTHGESPIAGHLLYTQALDDGDDRERAMGISAHLAWIRRADKVVVYEDKGVSDGMKVAIRDAMRMGVSIEYRKIDH